jgi:hypothetical protein
LAGNENQYGRVGLEFFIEDLKPLETLATNGEVLPQSYKSIVQEFYTEQKPQEMSKVLRQNQLSQRIQNDLSPNFHNDTVFDLAVKDEKYKKFELLFNFFNKSETCNTKFVYLQVMKYVSKIKEEPQLNKLFCTFFMDDEESGNRLTFGHRFEYNLPKFAKKEVVIVPESDLKVFEEALKYVEGICLVDR